MSRLRRLDPLRRALQSHPDRVDAAIALALLVPSVVQVLVSPIAPRGAGLVIALLSALPVAARRSRPAAAAVAGTLPWLIPADGYLYLGYVMAFLLFYSVAAHVEDARVVLGAVAFGVAASIFASAVNHEVTGEYFGAVTAVVVPAAVGRLVRRQRAQSRRLEELTVHLERERERGARAAVAEERARIARELHDVVAHGVSVIAVQSDAAEAALARDPELAAAPLRTIRGSATEALAEMRRLLGVLRQEGDAAELGPQPGLSQLDELVRRAEEGGVGVTLEVVGQPRPLPASLDLSAYRIVQEALTNVRKHSPGSAATVRLTWREDRLELLVANEGAPAPEASDNGGHGLVGMRERVRLHEGTLQAGPRQGGGWVVAASLPLEAGA